MQVIDRQNNKKQLPDRKSYNQDSLNWFQEEQVQLDVDGAATDRKCCQDFCLYFYLLLLLIF